jgi:hypothetical protein
MKRFVLVLIAVCTLSGCMAYTPYERRVYYGPGYYGPAYYSPSVVVVPRYEGRGFYHGREFHGGGRR